MNNKKKILEDKFLNKTIKILAIVLILLLIIYMSTLFAPFWIWLANGIRSVILPVFFAWLMSLIFYPAVKMLEKRGVGPRGISLLIVIVFVIGIMALIIYSIFPLIAQEIQNFMNYEIPNLIDYVSDTEGEDAFVNDFILGEDVYYILYDNLSSVDFSSTLASLGSKFVNDFLPSIASFVSLLAIAPFILLYYILDYEAVNDKLRTIIPNKYEKSVYDLGQRLTHTVGAYVRGQLMLMLAMGIFASIFYSIAGLKYYVVFGLIVGLTNVIPYFGMIVAAVIPLTFTLVSSDPGTNPLYVLGINFVLQFIEGNFFQPVIMGRTMELHPLIVLISITFFGTLFGLLGVIFATPIASSIREIINFSKEHIAARKKALEMQHSNKI